MLDGKKRPGGALLLFAGKGQFHRLFAAIGGAAVLAFAVALYWPGLSGSFFFDDEANVLGPEGLHLATLTFDALRDAWNSGISGPLGRPVAQLSFALNYFFGNTDPFPFKAVNLAIHLAVGILVFLIARHLLATSVAAALAAALWLLHPIQLTSVLYVVQRMTTLSALFLLAGFLLHVIGRERGGRVGAGLLLLSWGGLLPLSCLSKETGLLFPLFVLAWELIVRRGERGQLDWPARALSLVVGVGVLIGVGYALLPVGEWLWAGYAMRSFTPTERLLTEGRVLWFYLSLIVFPQLDVLSLYHDDLALSKGILEPWTTLAAWLGLLGLAWMAWSVRRKAPLLSFGIVWFFIGHAMESSVLPLEIAHEHRNYLPSFGIVLVAAWGFARVVEHAGWKKVVGIAFAISALVYLSLITALRAHQFGDELRRTQIESQFHPLSARAQYDAGRALASRVDLIAAGSPTYHFARTHFESAGAIDPDFKFSWLGLIHLNCVAGIPVEPGWTDTLVDRLQRSPFSPGDRMLLHGLKEMAIAGTICLHRTDVERMFAAANENVTVTPAVQALLHSWLADYLTLAVNDLPAARAELDRALELFPNDSSNRLKLAQLAYLQGTPAEAVAVLDSLKGGRLSRADAALMRLLQTCIDTGCVMKRD